MISSISVSEAKANLRASILDARSKLTEVERCAAAGILADQVHKVAIPPNAIVSGYLPIRGEADPSLVLERLAARGHRLALPVILTDRVTMVFRAWKPGDPLQAAGFGLSVPMDNAIDVVPDAMLVPLAAFDRRGYRIGYGKGHYDRAIARIESDGHVLKIGIAFAMQEIDFVPNQDHDRPLDYVATNEGLVDCGSMR